jgi:hypothetical protein
MDSIFKDKTKEEEVLVTRLLRRDFNRLINGIEPVEP